MKIHYFIEEKRDQKETSKPHQSRKKLKEKKKHRSHKTKEKLICTPQISTKTRRFQL